MIPRCILINRTDAIGDTILTLPMADRLKQVYPDAQIIFLTSTRARDLFINHPYVDHCEVYRADLSFFSRLKQLIALFRKYKPDVFFHVGGTTLTALVAFFFKTPFRGGIKSRWPTFLSLKNGIRQSRSLLPISECDHNLELLGPLLGDISPFAGAPAPHITLSEGERNDACHAFKAWLENEGFDSGREWIFIHPGMSGHTLNWASRNYARLILKLAKKYPKRFLFIVSHTPSDEPYLGPLREHLSKVNDEEIKSSVVFFNGALKGLRYSMNVMSFGKLFVGPSTGTTHLANCLGVSTIGIYSPIRAQSAVRWGPFYRTHSKVVVPDVVCGEVTRCALENCPYYECMAKIEVDDLARECETLLK